MYGFLSKTPDFTEKTERIFNMKKTIITLTLLAGIALNLFAQQYDPESDFEIYTSIARRGKSIKITKYAGSKQTVNIPPTIQGLPVTGIGEIAFRGKNITSVTIPKSVIGIGYSAFMSADLGSVTFEGAITANNLGKGLFNNGYFISPFAGDLRDKYLAGGIGTYKTTVPVSLEPVWTKQ